MKPVQSKTILVGVVIGFLFVLFALAIGSQVELALGTLLFIIIIIAWFVRSLTRGRR